MDGTRRTGSTLTGRPMREPAGRTRRDDAGDGGSQRGAAQDLGRGDHDTDVATSIETINKVTETYGILLDKLSAYELKVRDLTQKLAEEERVTGDALRAAARAEEVARDAQAKAARAEAEAARSSSNVHELERQLATLRAQTAKLMDAVDQLFPDADDGGADLPRGLRVVR